MCKISTAMPPILTGLVLLAAGGASAQQAGPARTAAGEPPPVAPWEAIVVHQLESADERMRAVGYTRYEAPRYDLLAADSVDTAVAELAPGAYRAVVVCDGDCTDVDLMVLDEAGGVLGIDVLEDDVPIVDFEVASGPVGLAVRMVRCSTDLCYYGLQLFRRND